MDSLQSGVKHVLGQDLAHRHNVISNRIPPALQIGRRDVVRFDVPGLPMPRSAVTGDEQRIDLEHPHTCVGPVAIDGAEIGATLVVELLDVRLGRDFGHCVILPSGLCPEVTSEPYVHSFEFEDGHAWLSPTVRIPLRPFCGIMGTMPAETGRLTTVTPRAVGGNLDFRRLTTGATLYLPIAVPGALFYCGDGHGVQGSGEVCGTALETAVVADLRFEVDEHRTIEHPEVSTAPETAPERPLGAYVATATGDDLYQCAQEALRRLLRYLERERDLELAQAYVLASLAADLTIEEIVNRGVWVVAASIPLHVFV